MHIIGMNVETGKTKYRARLPCLKSRLLFKTLKVFFLNKKKKIFKNPSIPICILGVCKQCVKTWLKVFCRENLILFKQKAENEFEITFLGEFFCRAFKFHGQLRLSYILENEGIKMQMANTELTLD
jgi:hypothetical protein